MKNINKLLQVEREAKAFEWLICRNRVKGYDGGCPEVDSSCEDKTCQECWLEYIDKQIEQEDEI